MDILKSNIWRPGSDLVSAGGICWCVALDSELLPSTYLI